MAEVTGSFTATGVSASLDIGVGASALVTLSGTFSAVVHVEFSDDGGDSWSQPAKIVSPDTVTVRPKENGLLRLRCQRYTSGTVGYAIETIGATTSPVVNAAGHVVAAAGENGLEVVKLTVVRDAPYGAGDSFQPVEADLEIAAAAGSDDGTDTSHLAAVMGHIIGDTVVGEGNYLGGVIGKLTIPGVDSDYATGGLLGVIGEATTGADGIVVAVLDGDDDGAATRAKAAYAVRMFNNNAGSGVDYGLDLKDDGSPHYTGTGEPFTVDNAEIRFSTGDVCVLVGAGAPTSGASGTGDNFAGTGSMYVDKTNANLYLQIGAITSPDWKLVTRAA